MKLIANDASELSVQQVTGSGDRTGMNTGESVKLYFAPSLCLVSIFQQ